jgi:hypothetical protein
MDLVERPEDLDELLALRALTDPLAADASEKLSLVALSDRYVGPRASVVMMPFLIVGPSRFSPGTYGVLYTADAFVVALRESSYHAGRYLRATNMTDATIVPRYALELSLDESSHADIRRGGADDVNDPAVYDPDAYTASQALGTRLRAEGREGVWYDCVRATKGTCYATFRPVAVKRVANTVREIELLWNGAEIAEYREVQTYRL